MGAPISSEWFSRPGCPAPDHSPVRCLLEKTIINIEMHLERLCDSLKADVRLISAHDLQQLSPNSIPGELDIDQVRVAPGDVVWQSLISNTCIHFSELQNLKFKRYDFSAEGMKWRRNTKLQFSAKKLRKYWRNSLLFSVRRVWFFYSSLHSVCVQPANPWFLVAHASLF